MIVFNLSCSLDHAFEGWFASSEAFEQQTSQGLVTCPVCGNHEVSRLPAVPHLRRSPVMQETAASVLSDDNLENLLQGLRQLLESSEDVGDHFADEARRIHFDEAPLRSIRGVTSLEEASELLDEGIPVLPLPITPKKGMH